MIDPGRLLELVARLADELEAEYGPGAELGAGVITVEVLIPDEDDDVGSVVEHRATTPSTAHALGLVLLTADSLRAPFERGDDDRDE